MKPLIYGGTLDILRRNADLTHEEVALLSKIPGKTLQRIFRGRGVPSLTHFLRLMKVLKVKPQRILDLFPPESFERFV